MAREARASVRKPFSRKSGGRVVATIKVGSHWRIRGDAYCWAVEQFKGVAKSGQFAGQEKWLGRTYHRRLGDAAVALAQRRLRTADVEGVQAVMDEWGRITGEIDAALAEWRPAA